MTTTTTTKAVTREELEALEPQVLEVPVSQYAIDKALELAEVRRQIRELQKSEDALKPVVAAAMGDADYGTFRGRRVIRATKGNTPWTDRKLLKEAFPEAFEATTRNTPWTSYKVVG